MKKIVPFVLMLILGLVIGMIISAEPAQAEPNKHNRINQTEYNHMRLGEARQFMHDRFEVAPKDKGDIYEWKNMLGEGVAYEAIYKGWSQGWITISFTKETDQKRWHVAWFRWYGPDYPCSQNACE